jgi:DNA repair protein RAD5
MKACGVGLNLVCASTVFIVDCWWNDAMEDQCVNRIHRIGQKAKIVRMRKFIVSDSVEEKIVKMQEQKKRVASEVLSNQDDVGNNKSNPTIDDFKAIFGR